MWMAVLAAAPVRSRPKVNLKKHAKFLLLNRLGARVARLHAVIGRLLRNLKGAVGAELANQLPMTGMPGTTAGVPSANGATRRAPLKRVCQYAWRISSTRTDEPARGAWMNLPSPM